MSLEVKLYVTDSILMLGDEAAAFLNVFRKDMIATRRLATGSQSYTEN